MGDVTKERGADRDVDTSRTIEGELFARYAGMDLDRWRVLVGGEVVHVDPRWGTGRVEDVRWGACCEHVAPTIQVRIRYADLGIVVFSASSFDAHHRSATISSAVRCIIGACYEEGRGEAEREAILERHTRELRAAADRQRLKRSEALRKSAICRKASGG